jgi:hypothetical protein
MMRIITYRPFILASMYSPSRPLYQKREGTGTLTVPTAETTDATELVPAVAITASAILELAILELTAAEEDDVAAAALATEPA